MIPLPTNCMTCPLARHLFNDRFACGNSLSAVTSAHHHATAECQQAVIDLSRQHYRPQLIDLQGISAEAICDRIGLELVWPDTGDFSIPNRQNAIEVLLKQLRIGYVKQEDRLVRSCRVSRGGDRYYGKIRQIVPHYFCDRLAGIRSTDPYHLALQMVHIDIWYGIPELIAAERNFLPDYF